MALRKAEKEEEKRAREKIRQKLEEDKVLFISSFFPNTINQVSNSFNNLIWSHLAVCYFYLNLS